MFAQSGFGNFDPNLRFTNPGNLDLSDAWKVSQIIQGLIG